MARARAAQIKQDFNNRYATLDIAVSPQTLVDARPVIDAITNQANTDPNLSGQQKADLLARVDYLKSMTYGQLGYNGPRYVGNLPFNPTNSLVIPLGQLRTFRTEMGDDIGTMRGIDQLAQGPARDAITNAMQGVYDQAGVGDQFRSINSDYALNHGPGTPMETLEAVSDKPVPGKPGVYAGGLNSKEAYDYLQRSRQASSNLDPLADPNNPDWRGTASQYLSGLGVDPATKTFSPDLFSRQLGQISDPNSRLAGAKRSPPWRNGCATPEPWGAGVASSSGKLGSSATLSASLTGMAAMHYLGEHLANAGIPAMFTVPAAIAGTVGLESGRGIQRQWPARATPLTDALYASVHRAAAAANFGDPIDPRTQSVYPPSPLDSLRPSGG